MRSANSLRNFLRTCAIGRVIVGCPWHGRSDILTPAGASRHRRRRLDTAEHCLKQPVGSRHENLRPIHVAAVGTFSASSWRARLCTYSLARLGMLPARLRHSTQSLVCRTIGIIGKGAVPERNNPDQALFAVAHGQAPKFHICHVGRNFVDLLVLKAIANLGTHDVAYRRIWPLFPRPPRIATSRSVIIPTRRSPSPTGSAPASAAAIMHASPMDWFGLAMLNCRVIAS